MLVGRLITPWVNSHVQKGSDQTCARVTLGILREMQHVTETFHSNPADNESRPAKGAHQEAESEPEMKSIIRNEVRHAGVLQNIEFIF